MGGNNSGSDTPVPALTPGSPLNGCSGVETDVAPIPICDIPDAWDGVNRCSIFSSAVYVAQIDATLTEIHGKIRGVVLTYNNCHGAQKLDRLRIGRPEFKIRRTALQFVASAWSKTLAGDV
ncbi:hypothetical protein BDZ89DRAFT_1067022 [Hymenopellis radicata]|nr:hypothetical protein BDZ89DRAFT_1067022 [Hymenopellis radicata]